MKKKIFQFSLGLILIIIIFNVLYIYRLNSLCLRLNSFVALNYGEEILFKQGDNFLKGIVLKLPNDEIDIEDNCLKINNNRIKVNDYPIIFNENDANTLQETENADYVVLNCFVDFENLKITDLYFVNENEIIGKIILDRR